jgi:hypothetical protein
MTLAGVPDIPSLTRGAVATDGAARAASMLASLL